jgi:MYXO-CTERM domain-containing protein
MRRTTTCAVLTAVLLAGPAVVTAEAQTPVAAQATTVQVTQARADDNNNDDNDDSNGGWGLWGLAGLLGLLGLIPRKRKTQDTGYRETGTGTGPGTGRGTGSHPDDRL